eukprot:TRINITY_DN50364_c0_g1_i1.p1 TRINITY_DN50364_c0_g1~~TRINITY_DN50364_c0_g1_i1.p1  ORF type:complete len:1203 (+),score=599.67 TRINITY_DN50364_c0_g1_i1:129-3737(+)
MWIKWVICDGFKSYAHRTKIGPFDREFNAITGLNGSGKSNILDAICFVFAISNLSKVRVRDLRELIYKSGQAGVTKASVTIEFDNTGEPKPLGYPMDEIVVSRQVVIGGRSKFFINGRTVQLSHVQNLFHSVQLNVNNPHFLIMQGTITKVINMKPQETLSMLEEAAGTRMFEVKKVSAYQQIQRKDQKLAEIDRQLEEDIAPRLKQLEAERREYDRFIQEKTEIEKLSRLKLAYDYEHAKEEVEKGTLQAQELRLQVQKHKQEVAELEGALKVLSQDIQQLRSGATDALQGAVNAAQAALDECKKRLGVCQAELKNDRKEMEQQTKTAKKLEEDQKKAKSALDGHAQKVQGTRERAERLEGDLKGAEQQVEQLQNQLRLLSSGIQATADGKSITEKLDQLNKDKIKCAGAVRQGEASIKSLTKQREEQKQRARASDADYQQLRQQFERASSELAKQEEVVKQYAGGYSPEREKEVKTQLHAKRNQLARIDAEISRLEGGLATRTQVRWKGGKCPADIRQDVKGRLCELLQVRTQPDCLPIQVAAGGALQQVVVKDEHVGKKVINSVEQRVTLVPLNKIQGSRIEPQVVQRASSIAESQGGFAKMALDLVDYAPEIQRAAVYALGQRLVCNDIDVATKVAFDPGVRRNCVTMGGELVNPGGVLTGGSTQDIDKTLEGMVRLRGYLEQQENLRGEVDTLQREHAQMAQLRAKYEELQDSLEDSRRKVGELKYKMQNNEQYRLKQEMEQVETRLQEAAESVEQNRRRLEEVGAEIAALQKEKEQGRGVEGKKKEVEQQIQKQKQRQKALKKEVDTLRSEVADEDAEREMLAAEVERVSSDLEQAEGRRKALGEAVDAKQAEIKELETTVKQRDAVLKEAKEKLDRANVAIQAKQEESKRLSERKGEAGSKAEELALVAKDREHETASRKRRVDELERSDFVKQNRAKFGAEGSDLDWRSIDYMSEFAKLDRLKADHLRNAKAVNQRVLSMFDAVEAQFQDVVKKRQQVAKDKQQVIETIEQLEEQKKQTIKDTYEKVTQDFSSIFATLLPGANAKLHADQDTTSGQIVGLAIRVAMGKSWKDGLTELSGGQRSLLALSLILALLKYKPAPVYILDEVDAALDLSHTQNIGKMLKNHFRNSQFLVVSLKEGMFNNANVLFRVRLADGQSQVTRSESSAAAAAPAAGRAAPVAGAKRPREGMQAGA